MSGDTKTLTFNSRICGKHKFKIISGNGQTESVLCEMASDPQKIND